MAELNRAGRYDRLGTVLRQVTGQPPMSIREFVSYHAGKFGSSKALIIPVATAPGPAADLLFRGRIRSFHRAGTDDYLIVPDEDIKSIESVLTVVDGKIVHATEEFSSHAPPSLPVLPEWSPIKVFGGYGAPLDVAKAARAGVPVLQHQHNSACHQHGCAHAAHQLLAGIEAARNRYSEVFGLGCECFAF